MIFTRPFTQQQVAANLCWGICSLSFEDCRVKNLLELDSHPEPWMLVASEEDLISHAAAILALEICFNSESGGFESAMVSFPTAFFHAERVKTDYSSVYVRLSKNSILNDSRGLYLQVEKGEFKIKSAEIASENVWDEVAEIVYQLSKYLGVPESQESQEEE